MTPAEAADRLLSADAELNAQRPTPFPVPVRGLEAVVAGALTALKPTDWWVPGLRERVGGVLRGAPLSRLVDGTAGARPYKIAPPSTAPALRALVAVGLAHATPAHSTLVHLGVGSTADGAFHEALNLAAQLQAPVIFLVAVHPLTQGAPLGPQLHASPTALAEAFGLKTIQVDGTQAQAVHEAVAEARAAHTPTLIEAQLAPPAHA